MWFHLYRATDGWVTVCCVTDTHRTGLLRALGLFSGGGPDDDGDTAPLVDEVADAVGLLTVESALSALHSEGVPAAQSPGDPPRMVIRGKKARIWRNRGTSGTVTKGVRRMGPGKRARRFELGLAQGIKVRAFLGARPHPSVSCIAGGRAAGCFDLARIRFELA